MTRRLVAVTVTALLATTLGGCGRADEGRVPLGQVLDAMATTTTSSVVATTSTTTPALPSTTSQTVSTTAVQRPTTTRAPRPRTVVEQDWTPFATVGGVTLRHPSRRVELVGFHESNNDAARELTALETAANPTTLQSRNRDTGVRTAADVVSDPDVEIRAPVTGKVKRAGTYVLYCKHRDDYVVIEPDDHPGWEVKLLHIDGVRVRAGDRVVAGETVLAPRPTRLPFDSQVDEVTAPPAWPHVHIEVVDPSIPDRPGAGC